MSLLSSITQWFTQVDSAKVLSKDAVAFHKRRNKADRNAAIMAQLSPIWSMSDKLLHAIDWEEGTLHTVPTQSRWKPYKEIALIGLPHQWFELIYKDEHFVASSYSLGSDGVVYHRSYETGNWSSTEHYRNVRFLEEIRLHLVAACRQRGVHITYEEMGTTGAHIQMLIHREQLNLL